MALNNSSQIIFQQDGAPPHWARPLRDWLNENLPNRWIGRENHDDQHIPWPPRSPDLTPLDYFLWGFIKSKVYVRNYQNQKDMKASMSAAFRLVTDVMLSSTMSSSLKRIKKVIEVRGRHVD